MRTNARSLPALYSALILAASAAAVSGCGKPEANPVRLDAGHAVPVIVTYNKDKDRGEILDPDADKRITLRKDKDWAVWASPDGDVEVTFSSGSPFDSPPKHDKKVLKSERAKHKGDFPYVAKLVLWGDDPSKAKDIDPIIVVME